MDIDITYDGYKARIITPLPLVLQSQLKALLTYKDKSKQYLATQKGYYQDYYVVCFENDQSFLTGLLSRVIHFLIVEGGHNVKVSTEVPEVQPEEISLPDWLYPHQVDGIKMALLQRRIMIQSPTGSGKATLLAYFAKHFPREKILVTVPSCNLLNNMVNLLTEVLEEPIGVIGDSQTEIKRVNVGIINSLVLKREELKDLLGEVTVVIRDEAHSSACRSHILLSEYLRKVCYSVGLTATAFRADGAELLLEGVCGPTSLKISEQELVDKGIILKPEYYMIQVPDPNLKYTGAKMKGGRIVYDTLNGKPDPGVVYNEALVQNEARNHLIIDVLIKFLNSPIRTGPALILVKSVAHGKILVEIAKSKHIHLDFIHGCSTSKTREKFIEALRNNSLSHLCATSILNEGEDIRPLQLLINAAGTGAEKDLVQKVGRILRTHPSKRRAIVVDFYDRERFYLEAHSFKRRRAIEKRYPGAVKEVTFKELPF